MGENTEVILGPFQGEYFLTQRLQSCITYACQHEMDHLIFCDEDFAHWPLDNASVLDALTQWARSTSNQRQLTVIAATYRVIESEHSLWKNWRQNWSHRIQCLQVDEGCNLNVPCVFWSDNLMLVVQNKDHASGAVQQEKLFLSEMHSQLNDLKSHSSPAFPATTLGL